MTLPNGILEFLVFLLPPIMVALTAYLLIKRFLDREQQLKVIETKASIHKDLLPLRLQAYERLTIYLERISPNIMLLEKHEAGMSVLDFQRVLVASIRHEFEHNLSQQIYITTPLWTIIRNTKEEVIRTINTAATSLNPDEPAHFLSKKVFEMMLEKEEFATQRALNILKSEVAQLF
jgi:hypothetical protein